MARALVSVRMPSICTGGLQSRSSEIVVSTQLSAFSLLPWERIERFFTDLFVFDDATNIAK